MNQRDSVDLELTVTGIGQAMRVRIGASSQRYVATIQVAATRTSGIGPTAREALVAALAPFGGRLTTAVMAAPAMFGASAALLASGQ